jgi:Serine aminopeptidase, S33
MIERTFVFGTERHLVGTVTSPQQARPGLGRTMLLLTNAGVIPRIGPHRLNVRLARRFAELGIGTFRFDMSGLGDSRRSSSRQSTGEQFVADAISAMELAKAEFGADQFLMVGFCSGGDIAHLTALADARLRAIVLWDSYVYPTRQTKLLGLLHRLRGKSLAALAAKVARRVGSLATRREEGGSGETAPAGPMIFGRTKMPPRNEFGQRIRTLVDRGVEVLFLYSGGEPLWYNYERQFADTFASYGFVGRVGYEYLPRSDHTFIQPHAQATLIERVERWLNERALPALERERAAPIEAAVSPSLMMA